MYVKAVPDKGNETIYPTGDSPVTTGTVVLYDPLTYDGQTADQLLGLEGSSLIHCLGPYLDYFAGEEVATESGIVTKRWWLARFAWWEVRKPDHFFEGVIVGGQLYLIGDNGKTIDRVR